MLAVFFRRTKTTLVTNLAKSVYRKMIAITSFTLAKPPNYVFSKKYCKMSLCGVLYSASLCNILCTITSPFYQKGKKCPTPMLLRLPFGFPLDRPQPQGADQGTAHRDDPPVGGKLAAQRLSSSNSYKVIGALLAGDDLHWLAIRSSSK